MAASQSARHGTLGEYEGGSGDSNLPVPDPARLATQLVDRAITAFREVFEGRIGELNRAIALATNQVDKIPADTDAKLNEMRADVDRQVLALRELIMSQMENIAGVSAEKFQAINTRFIERDVRIRHAARESRMSFDAALAAAKEAIAGQNEANAQAIAKAELATQKQIDAISVLMTNNTRSLEDKISDLKTRLDRGEGRNTGSTEAKTEKRLDLGSVLQAIAVLATIVGLVIVTFHK
jgi:hypothetical protein